VKPWPVGSERYSPGLRATMLREFEKSERLYLDMKAERDRLAERCLALEELLQRDWEHLPRFTLCRDTGRQAVAGTCPEHGGDACLFEYVQMVALKRAAEEQA
jgi:hypothetical protein